MSRVDFYNLPTSSPDDALLFICKLTNRIWQQTMSAYIHCQTDQQRQQLNTLLWQYKADSFIPHALLEDNSDSAIALGIEPMDYELIKQPICINLHNLPPKNYSQFERIIELVVTVPELKEQARANYRFYKEAQCLVNYHNIVSI